MQKNLYVFIKAGAVVGSNVHTKNSLNKRIWGTSIMSFIIEIREGIGIV